MQLEINKDSIQAAIQQHLDKTVKDGIDYKVREAVNDAVADAITPEIVQGYADAAIKALTDPAVTERIVREMNEAMAEVVRVTMQEAIVSVVVKLRDQRRCGGSTNQEQSEEIRKRLFPEEG